MVDHAQGGQGLHSAVELHADPTILVKLSCVLAGA
jgi:hypothetical protein